jgi:hypothetical protein
MLAYIYLGDGIQEALDPSIGFKTLRSTYAMRQDVIYADPFLRRKTQPFTRLLDWR